MRVTGLVVAAALSIGVAAFPASAVAVPKQEPPSTEELASIGCLVAGTATAALVGTFGIMTMSATGGAAAAYSAEALPILGAAFAAGCGVGVMAAPGAAWIIDHFFGEPDDDAVEIAVSGD